MLGNPGEPAEPKQVMSCWLPCRSLFMGMEVGEEIGLHSGIVKFIRTKRQQQGAFGRVYFPKDSYRREEPWTLGMVLV